MDQALQLLTSCTTRTSLRHGRQLHLLLFKSGLQTSFVTIANRLVQMYAKCGSMEDARKVFDEMPDRNCFTWNCLIESYMKSGQKEESLQLFYSMPDRNDFSWNVAISGCAKLGDLESAKTLFDRMPKKNAIAGNAVIHGLLKNGNPRQALKVFKELCFDGSIGRDGYVLASVIGACSDTMALGCGKQVHARIVIDNVGFDAVLASSLVHMYCKCGDSDNGERVFRVVGRVDAFSTSALIAGFANAGRIECAKRVFEKVVDPCVVVWNSMISGLVSRKEEEEALVLFNSMRKRGVCEDCSTLSSVLSACSGIGNVQNGMQVHARAGKAGVVMDTIVGCALIDMYSKCGDSVEACKLFDELEFCDTILLNSMINVYSNCGRVQEAKHIFDRMPQKSLISWNSMVIGLSQNGLPMEALDLFSEMNKRELRMDKFSVASAISACASISCIERGEQCFGRTIRIGLDSDPIICTALIDLFCKCGFVDLGRRLFNSMSNPDVVSWNSMLVGYATNGHGKDALILFSEMKGVLPNEITFMAILSACGHCGLVVEARKWFRSMQSEFQIKPRFEHYSCMVDLYSRAGFLEEAMEVIEVMPYEADASMWCCVLRGCVNHGNKDLGKKVAEMLIEVEPENSVAYVQLCGVLAGMEDWEGMERVRSVMKTRRVEKNPGISWG